MNDGLGFFIGGVAVVAFAFGVFVGATRVEGNTRDSMCASFAAELDQPCKVLDDHCWCSADGGDTWRKLADPKGEQ